MPTLIRQIALLLTSLCPLAVPVSASAVDPAVKFTTTESPVGAKIVAFHGYAKAIELTNENVRVVLCPEVGGRVLEYSYKGTNALFLSEAEMSWKPGDPPESSAGRFDIGPELVIPNRPVLWSGAWTGKIIGDRSARLESQSDPATGVKLVREFVLAADSTHLACTQTIVNVSDSRKEWCHWSRTFAVGKGICLIPVTEPSRFPNHYVMYEEGSLINMRPEDPQIRVRDGFIEILGAPRKPKLGFDSSSGTIAYVAPNNLLFVKKFVTDRNRVFNEAAGLTISVWYPRGEMIELEPIGPREDLEPGSSASFTENWWLAPMPFPQAGEDIDLQQLNQKLQLLK